jgi:uncharacterized protein (TIGR00375 family)
MTAGLTTIYADLHIHLGCAGADRPVKISAARDLTLAGILHEARTRKGIELIGVIDATTTHALADLADLLAAGDLAEQVGGGLRYRDAVTLLPGAEVEVVHAGRPLHLLCYFPGYREAREFSRWQSAVVKNLTLSTQRHRATPGEVVQRAAELGGVVIPAHIFTPFKSLLAAAPRVAEVIDPGLWAHVPAVELGLSSDTAMADELPELGHFAYVTNSDAHSLPRIGREHNALTVAAPTFDEWLLALREQGGRRVAANYGLDPRLGKYHRTYCLACDAPVPGEKPVLACPVDPGHKLVLGVADRLAVLAAAPWQGARRERVRPPYVHQVPLDFIPGLGKRAMTRLFDAFGSEMQVLHHARLEELAEVVGPQLAGRIDAARRGELTLASGAGGHYGRVVLE